MASSDFKLYCCGSRGSWPVEGHTFNEFGGYTSCYVLKKEDYALVIDCGTGFYSAISLFNDCKNVDVVLTHMHYDHILGLLKWSDLPKNVNMTFYASGKFWEDETIFDKFFSDPFWPVEPRFNLKPAPAYGIPLNLEKDLTVSFYKANHPNRASLLIINYNEEKIVVMFDNETNDTLDLKLIDKCNILIYDGMFTKQEHELKKGFGHSSWHEGIELAKKINCDRLIITHHSPNREDRELLAFEKQARELYPFTDFARAGQAWPFPLIRQDIYEELKQEHHTFIDDIKASINKAIYAFDEIVSDEEKLHSYISSYAYIIMFFVSAFMTIVNVFTGKKLLMLSTLIFAIVSLVDAMFVKVFHVSDKIVDNLFIGEAIMLCTFFLVVGTPEGFSILWCLLLPTGGMIVFGRKRATIASIVMLAIILFFFRTEIGQSCLVYQYNESYKLRFPMAFLAFLALSYFLDFVRNRTLSILENNKKEQETKLSNQTQELRDQNFSLSSMNAKLEMRNQLLSKTFGRLLPDEVITNFLNDDGDLKLAGEKSFCSLLNVNIRGFCELSNGVSSTIAIDKLSTYISNVMSIVQRHNGSVLEFGEKGIFAVFGAPNKLDNHSDEAIACAIEIQAKHHEFTLSRAYKRFPLQVSSCVHTGEVLLGTIGSEKHLKFDVLGECVDICKRMAYYTTAGEVMCSQQTIDALSTTLHITNQTTVLPNALGGPLTIYTIDGIGQPYNLSCPKIQEKYRKLKNKLDITFIKLNEDCYDNNIEKGKIVACSSQGIVLETKSVLNDFNSIKLNYGDGVICKTIKCLKKNTYELRYIKYTKKFDYFKKVK